MILVYLTPYLSDVLSLRLRTRISPFQEGDDVLRVSSAKEPWIRNIKTMLIEIGDMRPPKIKLKLQNIGKIMAS